VRIRSHGKGALESNPMCEWQSRKPHFVGVFFLTAVVIAASMSSVASPSSAGLQQAVNRAMANQGGALVVIDVTSGGVLAAHRLDLAGHVLEAPGSTLKPIVLMALLESGKLDPKQVLACKHELRVGSVRMDCSHSALVVGLNAEDAIAYSCNSYLAQVAPRLSPLELVQAFERAGLNSPTGLLSGEAVGRISQPADSVALQLEALGQSGIEVTPLELLQAYRKIAMRMRDGNIGAGGPVFAGLEESVAYGMASAANIHGLKIAGKTGTASSRTTARTHGFFVGYSPGEKPEIALVVFLERGRGLDAAAVAQPVFSEFAGEKKNP
jgi:cell division protein FtsI/penicillin-binding protein 2